MSGGLYQLKTRAPVGAYVTFKGPYDKYGQVIKHQDSGFHLIRGVGLTPPPGVRHFHIAETSS